MELINYLIQPIHKVDIYKKAKDIIYQLMDRDIINPARAKKIIINLKKDIPIIKNQKQAKEYIKTASEQYPELKNLPKIFENELNEKYEKLITKIIDIFLEKWKSEIVETLIYNSKKIDSKDLIQKLKKEYTKEFNQAIKTISKQS